MIRLANPSDLDAIAEIYEEILAAEDAPPGVLHQLAAGKVPHPGYGRGRPGGGHPVGGGGGRSGIRLRQPEWGAAARVRRHPLVYSRPALGGGCDPHPGHPAQLVREGKGPGSLWPSARRSSAARGKKTVRLDTYEGNLPANTMYPRLGYTFAGATEFFLPGVYS